VTLDTSNAEKDLGVTVDNELKFSKHIETQVAKANKILGLIRRSFQHLDIETMRSLYTSLVRPHLEYANVVWSPRLIKDIKLIENVQRRATKIIPGMKDKDYAARLKEFKIPSMNYRRERGDMIEVYKYTHDFYDTPLLLTRDNGNRTRGHSLKMKKNRWETTLRQKFFSERIVDSWNSLPENVINAASLNGFKNGLDLKWNEKRFIFNQ